MMFLQPDLWQYALGFLSEVDLCAVALLNHEFYNWAIADCFWKVHCYRQFWDGTNKKQMTARQQELLFSSSAEEININLPTILSWKQRYALAVSDSRRQHITREEICFYSWKLTYNGHASKLGLRKFLRDGTYHSPYAGRCDWNLDADNNCLVFMGITLNIERDLQTWGWIIGPGTGTVYKSTVVDDNATTTEEGNTN